MQTLQSWLSQFGVLLVYLNVAADAAGLPVPSFPLLLLSGALVKDGVLSPLDVVGAALCGAVTADFAWYWLGRTHGRSLLAVLCRISLSPDSCVRQTEAIFLRHGAKSLLVAKFIPGFAVMASSMAGRMRIPFSRFVLVDAIGILLWSGVWVTTGVLAGPLVSDIVAGLQKYGRWGALFVVIAICLYLTWKWLQRRVAETDRAIPRMTIHELKKLQDAGRPLVLLDVRAKEIQAAEGRIPGALSISVESPVESLREISRNAHVVVYCGCPNEVSAVHMVKRLRAMGHPLAQPLAGGIDAWVDQGLVLEFGTTAE
jgi:membrane protein DedA with SNARE-associated domain